MKKMSKLISVVLCVCILAACAVPASAGNEISVFLNNHRIEFDTAPVLQNGTTLVQMRAVCEKMGAEVTWDNSSGTATAVRGDTTVSAAVGENELAVNDSIVAAGAPTQLINGSTFVPVRALCEAFGGTVDWDGNIYKVSVDIYGENRRNGGISALKPTKTFEERMELLREKAFASQGLEDIEQYANVFDRENPYIVFVSLCDAKSRAMVVHESGASAEEAWSKAQNSAKKYIEDNNYNALWIKVDIVDSMQKRTLKQLKAVVEEYHNEFYREGIAFDDDFDIAVLEAEINGNKIIDYKGTKEIDLEVLNDYLSDYGRKTLDKVPDEVTTFTCIGFMCDENNEVYELNGYGSNDGLDYGRRSYAVDRDAIEDVVLSGSYWLKNEVQDDGTFNYGYYPTYDRLLVDYNYLRHMTGILPLIWTYTINSDEDLIDPIERTLDNLLAQIEKKSDNVSYVVDGTEIKLGGNGIAIILLDTYMKTFGRDENLVEICEMLGEGILELQNADGSYYHVLNPDFTRKEEFRTVYYDGEATYGLCLLYEMTNDKKWLNAGQKAVDNFVEENYIRYRDHWVAYAVNELTKHVKDEKYFEFGLRNLQENMRRIHNQETTYHTYMELLLAGFEMYDRMVEQNIDCDYLEEFDGKYFAETIQRRAEHMLNGFFYPEYAMYLKNPEAIVGTFHVRHDGYRVRIDDVDHFIAGYYHYWQLYDKVQKYMK